MNENKNILIAVSGLTPQIITESLYCLTIKEKKKIDSIYIITTTRGRDVLLGKDKFSTTVSTSLKSEIAKMCHRYKIPVPLFENNSKHIIVAKEESTELKDIRSDKHNRLFPNKVAEFIKNKTSDADTTLHCLISGGRKSMSVHIAFALSLFGRQNDRLLHILTSEENEFKGFYPDTKKEAKALELSEIPFVRLRSVIGNDFKNKKIMSQKFVDIVKYTQKQVKLFTSDKKMFLAINCRELIYDSNRIHLEPLEFAIYYSFVEAVLEGSKKSFSINVIQTKEFASKVELFIREYYEYYYFSEETRKPWWDYGFSPENFRTKRTKINSKLKSLFADPDLYEIFKIDSKRIYGETNYFVNADRTKLKIIF